MEKAGKPASAKPAIAIIERWYATKRVLLDAKLVTICKCMKTKGKPYFLLYALQS